MDFHVLLSLEEDKDSRPRQEDCRLEYYKLQARQAWDRVRPYPLLGLKPSPPQDLWLLPAPFIPPLPWTPPSQGRGFPFPSPSLTPMQLSHFGLTCPLASCVGSPLVVPPLSHLWSGLVCRLCSAWPLPSTSFLPYIYTKSPLYFGAILSSFYFFVFIYRQKHKS